VHMFHHLMPSALCTACVSVCCMVPCCSLPTQYVCACEVSPSVLPAVWLPLATQTVCAGPAALLMRPGTLGPALQGLH
jgi:hypothetical protein